MKYVSLLLSLLLCNCAAAKWYAGTFTGAPPADASLMAPPLQDMSQSLRTIRVSMHTDGPRPYCTAPDAAEVVDCHFTMEYFMGGGAVVDGMDGWRRLSPNGARAACSDAMFAMRGLWHAEQMAAGAAGDPWAQTLAEQYIESDISTCANLLLQYRFQNLAPKPGPE